MMIAVGELDEQAAINSDAAASARTIEARRRALRGIVGWFMFVPPISKPRGGWVPALAREGYRD
jgi:hypothetical protein